MLNQSFDLPQIDLGQMLIDPDPTNTRPRRNLQARNDPLETETLDDWLVAAALPAIEQQTPVVLAHAIHNTDRTIGARLAGEIARRYGDAGLPRGTIRATFAGSAGQSFGAFCINGVQFTLIGEANDYVGKGMAGGEIILRSPLNARWATQENFIAGNTCLYGATGGALFAAGRVGERFAVRNCGSVSVVEGAGDHACEYMTSGTVVVLGSVGQNFGAGMTGGIAYVYDDENKFAKRLNRQLVRAQRLANSADEEILRGLIQRHCEATDSVWAQLILARWSEAREQFWQIVPK